MMTFIIPGMNFNVLRNPVSLNPFGMMFRQETFGVEITPRVESVVGSPAAPRRQLEVPDPENRILQDEFISMRQKNREQTRTQPAVTVKDSRPGPLRIADIRSNTHISPFQGRRVTNVPGVVTAVLPNGFFFQDDSAAYDGVRSTGIFVFGKNHSVATGDRVFVSGKVEEFRPRESHRENRLSISNIIEADVEILSSNNPLPAPIKIGRNGRIIPSELYQSGFEGDIEQPDHLIQPETNAIDFFESLSGMRVMMENPVALSPYSGRRFAVMANDYSARPHKTSAGGVLRTSEFSNADRLMMSAEILSTPEENIDVGARLGPVHGIMHYSHDVFSGYYNLILTDNYRVVVPGNMLDKRVSRIRNDQETLTVATLNVAGLGRTNGDTIRRCEIAEQIRHNLGLPDVVVLNEVRDNSLTDKSSESSSRTLLNLIREIEKESGVKYDYREIIPENGADGGKPGYNIRSVFLFNPQRVRFNDRTRHSEVPQAFVGGRDGNPVLLESPGRIDPNNEAFANSRKPLVGEFEFNGKRVFIAGVHFISKVGDDPTYGKFQPPRPRSAPKRKAQAEAVKLFLDDIREKDPDAFIIVAGDLNDYDDSEVLATITSSGMINTAELVPESERYSFNHLGNSEDLDHILVSQSLRDGLRAEILHINADYTRSPSDHDPVKVGVRIRP